MRTLLLLFTIAILLTPVPSANAQDRDVDARFSSYNNETAFIGDMFLLCEKYKSSFPDLDRLIMENNPDIARSHTDNLIRYSLPPLDFHRAREIMLEVNINGEVINSCAASLGRVIYYNTSAPAEKE